MPCLFMLIDCSDVVSDPFSINLPNPERSSKKQSEKKQSKKRSKADANQRSSKEKSKNVKVEKTSKNVERAKIKREEGDNTESSYKGASTAHDQHLEEAGGVRLFLSPGSGAGEATESNTWEWTSVPAEKWAAGNSTMSFAPSSVSAIYASQVLQTFHYTLDDEVQRILKSWYNLLEPGGKLYLSVPDFPTLCWLYLAPSISMNGRFRILQMMMGNQENRFKVSRSGFDIQFLGYHLNEAGFSEFERVPEFNLFNDESSRKASASDVAHIAIPDAGHVISHLLMV
uniref:Uncharacterized protein n=1 Tax=Guillardia theta TaxID=55529 RepID=A0A7S4KG71_GUITH|mmetsp:Transcript_24245/g.79010  ORF Transcript_24245/g.79010 Transcript_24245/m.79010 type:complete len:285 (+) Transcript_24245:306-1160(+)